MKKKITSVVIVTSIFLIIFILVGCLYKVAYKKNEDVEDISKEKLLNFILCQQNTDGGFSVEVPNLYSDLSDTYCTIMALKSLEEDIDVKSIHMYLKEINLADLRDTNNSITLTNYYHYIKICRVVGFCVDENIISQVLQDVKKIMEEQRLTDIVNGYEEVIKNSCELLWLYNEEVDIEGLLISLVERINLDDFSTDMRSLISTSCYIAELIDQKFLIDKGDLVQYIDNYILLGNEIDIGQIWDIYTIAQYCGYNIGNYVLINTERIWVDNGYKISSNAENCNIKATFQVLFMCKELNLNIDKTKKSAIVGYINDCKSYRGNYSFSYRESDMYSTYYALKIIEYIDDNKTSIFKEIIENIKNYINNSSRFFENMPTSEQLFYLKCARELDIPFQRVETFLDSQFNILKSASINKNGDLVVLLLDLAKQYDYEITEDIKENISKKIISENEKIDDDLMRTFINQCNITQIQLLLEKKIEKNEIIKLIRMYEKNINEQQDILYITSKLCRTISCDEYNKRISSDTKEKVIDTINENSSYGVYKYSSSYVPTFESVYELLNVVTYIKNP